MKNVVDLGRVVELSWDAMSCDGGTLRNPEWDDIEHRVRSLKTPDHSMVLLKTAAGEVLTVAGDAEHGYLTFISDEKGQSYVMAPPTERKGKVSMVVGFQPGEYAKRILVDLDAALRVARTFFKTGRADVGLEWTQDDSVLE